MDFPTRSAPGPSWPSPSPWTMAVLDGAIANVALPSIARDAPRRRPPRSIWVVNAYQLAVTISLLPLASLGDIIGYRRIYCWGAGAVHRWRRSRCALSPSLTDADGGAGAAGLRRRRHHERQHRRWCASSIRSRSTRARRRQQRRSVVTVSAVDRARRVGVRRCSPSRPGRGCSLINVPIGVLARAVAIAHPAADAAQSGARDSRLW